MVYFLNNLITKKRTVVIVLMLKYNEILRIKDFKTYPDFKKKLCKIIKIFSII